jgi:alanine dehydrogenase
VKQLAREGSKTAILEDGAVRSAANVIAGKVTLDAVAKSFGVAYVPAERAF